ncbi:MAG TPA: dienelactone hydrolase family protein [Sphingobium sp.]|uniref:dienelactone hydrolase family protein n=1 Tax=Sphingobium sp. TaxID=1912891 RepID=UPI002ED50B93
MTDLLAVELHHDGADLVSQLALPAGPGPHPAVLVIHNAHGLGPHMVERAQTLAAEGYAALAVDMYGGGKYYPRPEEAGEPFMAVAGSPERLRSRVNAWLDCLKARPEVDASRVAAIGYCFGGMCVLELVRTGADAKAVISYHGILKTTAPAQPGAVKAKVAVYTGGKDPYAPREDVVALEDEMIAAGADYQITTFGEAYHSFTDPNAADMGRPGIAYDPMAERMSWAGTLELLKAVLVG